MALTWLKVCVQSNLVFERKKIFYLKTTPYNKFQTGFLLRNSMERNAHRQTNNIFDSSLWTQKPDKWRFL